MLKANDDQPPSEDHNKTRRFRQKEILIRRPRWILELVIGPEFLRRLLGAENVTRKDIYCLATFWKSIETASTWRPVKFVHQEDGSIAAYLSFFGAYYGVSSIDTELLEDQRLGSISHIVNMTIRKINRDSATAFHGHCVWSSSFRSRTKGIWRSDLTGLCKSHSNRAKTGSGKTRWLHVKDIGNNVTVASETGRDRTECEWRNLPVRGRA
ncbi:uncharacterized protein EV420DRAFT_1482746 [Desarmillaria tabescens]|uniref:Uncharacterized protein n=1 Tax=Armillaria tabescens TaxID=1929756 RepID=A0AA39JX51_ARMTA|nr:uncharacterized protein EV420DRAFT_1482746 [Desarmillaria tabescens]KAK0450547.1 hypothetical protein EV420DRAFT_1482746 [Desarmillaria tabescens]